MAVNSRDKGKRAEYAVRDLLRKYTGMKWERVPGSGAFDADHGLKGDIYLPCVQTKGLNKSLVCIEVKHYKDDVINSNLLRPAKQTLEEFWRQTLREAEELNKIPVLVFKKDRGKWLVAVMEESDKIAPGIPYPGGINKYITYEVPGLPKLHIYDFESYLAKHHEEFYNG